MGPRTVESSLWSCASTTELEEEVGQEVETNRKEADMEAGLRTGGRDGCPVVV